MSYVDGFVLAVPTKNLAAYKRMAKLGAKIWMEHGALEYRECVADDVKPGKLTSFPQSVKLKKGETVVFSWIVYKSRASRDRINAKVMKDPRLAEFMDPKSLPFDGKRMFWGGFKTFVKA
ncbi:MAG: RNA signal recognition particle [Gammaproteobacteria bacterium RIFCSPHIGHO2_12_FULL_63_22]|nr:MAG: RNA signal recognition particle [Gammaproteobacteria bacterium RIFCSPHIGHO2_12_FULL_63_22]